MTHRTVMTMAAVIGLLWFGSAAAQTRIERLVMPGPLTTAHAKYENECEKCHELLSKKAQTRLCRDCHDEIAADIKARAGYHGRIEGIDTMECRRCHTEHVGRQADIVLLDEGTFVHARTDFPLEGAHQKVKCAACHAPDKRRRETPHDCYSCHRTDDAHQGKLGRDCHDCHDERAWIQARDRFDHEKTHFPLHGKHREAACASCHPAQRYRDIPHACHDCHALNDVHAGRYGDDCAKCHAEEGWKQLAFDHTRDTRYPLEGRHRDVACDACHAGRLYEDKLETACVACHRPDDQHQGRYGTRCEDCHKAQGWRDARFDHDRDTKFPLRGRHAQVACSACHREEGNAAKVPRDCVGCHETDDHHAGKLGRKCETCHRVESWQVLRFDHNKDTKYPLSGRHASVRCEACHTGQSYTEKLGTACIDCHRTDDPHHGQQGDACERCHDTAGWTQTRFDHDLTDFPLIGLHAATPCEGCHLSAAFKDAAVKCVECHRGDDVHTARLGSACAECHNPNDWKLWDFDHDARTHYRLDGAHRGLSCVACHTAPVTGRISLSHACYGCHVNDDVHNQMFGRACEQCHNTRTFKDVDVRR